MRELQGHEYELFILPGPEQVAEVSRIGNVPMSMKVGEMITTCPACGIPAYMCAETGCVDLVALIKPRREADNHGVSDLDRRTVPACLDAGLPNPSTGRLVIDGLVGRVHRGNEFGELHARDSTPIDRSPR